MKRPLSDKQRQALALLKREGGASNRELRKAVGVTEGGLGNLLTAIERRGYLLCEDGRGRITVFEPWKEE